MLKRSLFAAAAILAALSLAACGNSSKTAEKAAEPAAEEAGKLAAEAVEPVEEAGEQAAEAAELAEGETTTEESTMKITSVLTNTNKDKKTNTNEEAPAGEEDVVTPADTAAEAPADNVAALTADTPKETDEAAEVGKEQEEEQEAEDTKAADERIGTVSADGDGLSLRDGPSSDNERLDLIPDGTELVIEEEQDGWGYVEYGGTHGWVSLDFIAE